MHPIRNHLRLAYETNLNHHESNKEFQSNDVAALLVIPRKHDVRTGLHEC